MKLVNEFKKNKYAVIRNVLDRQSQSLCFEYIKVMVERYKVIITKFPRIDTYIFLFKIV